MTDVALSTLPDMLSWADVGTLVQVLADAIGADGWRPDVVVAVAHGGLTPAHLLAQRIDVREVTSVGVRFVDQVRTRMRVYATPTWPLGTPRRVLVVEDAVDTGRLLQAAAGVLPGEVRTAALVAVGRWRPTWVGSVQQTIPTMPWEASSCE